MATKLNINAVCQVCGTCYRLSVDAENYLNWQEGEGSIRELLPELSPNERELLISGTCVKCFDDMFLLNSIDDGCEEEQGQSELGEY